MKTFKEELEANVNQRLNQLQQWVSPNQLDEKIEQLGQHLKTDFDSQKSKIIDRLTENTNEMKDLNELVREYQSQEKVAEQ